MTTGEYAQLSNAEYLADLKARLGYPPPNGDPVRLSRADLEECLRRWPLRAVAAGRRLVLLRELLAAAPPELAAQVEAELRAAGLDPSPPWPPPPAGPSWSP